jgi:hypothetical protein
MKPTGEQHAIVALAAMHAKVCEALDNLIDEYQLLYEFAARTGQMSSSGKRRVQEKLDEARAALTRATGKTTDAQRMALLNHEQPEGPSWNSQ